MTATQCGLVALVGRPNVGKSTLMNHLVGQKISITSRRPQTTRHRVMGVLTQDQQQLIFVDTPGMHQNAEKAINQQMNRTADRALKDVDVVVFMVERTVWRPDDEAVLQKLIHCRQPVVLVINKVDQIEDKSDLLPFIERISARLPLQQVFPVSALHGHNREALASYLLSQLPEGPFLFDEDQVTDRSLRFMASEIVREKIMRQLGAEVPYSVAVEIERFEHKGHIIEIHALILVERDGQKKIVIGDGGSRLKNIGTQARQDMEIMFDAKVMLHLWVKVKSNWSDDDRALRSLGLSDD